jgi:hypothetical protein
MKLKLCLTFKNFRLRHYCVKHPRTGRGRSTSPSPPPSPTPSPSPRNEEGLRQPTAWVLDQVLKCLEALHRALHFTWCKWSAHKLLRAYLCSSTLTYCRQFCSNCALCSKNRTVCTEALVRLIMVIAVVTVIVIMTNGGLGKHAYCRQVILS